MKLLEEKDFEWKIKKTNNIKTNPIEYWYTTYHDGDVSRKYYIVPQYTSIDGITINSNSEIELYVYFEARGYKLKDGEKECKYDSIGDGYKYEEGTFKRAFKTIEEAKHRAYMDYCGIYGYVRAFFIE